MSTDNSPSFGLGTMPNLANAQAKEAAITPAPSGWVESPQTNYVMGTNQDSGDAVLTPLARGGSFNYTSPQPNYSVPQPSPMPMQMPQQMQGMQPQINPNQPMSFGQFQQQMFGQPQGMQSPYSPMMQMQQQMMAANARRGMLQKAGVLAAALLGGPAAAAQAAQGMQQGNAQRANMDASRMQAQMEMMKLAADNDPNSLKNRMAVMQAWQGYQNQNADNARAQAALDETARHNKAGEAATTATNDLAQAQLKYNMSNDSFKNWLAAQQFGETKSNNAATQKHQANVDALAQFMQGHTLAQDALANKRADAQTAYQNAQLANATRTYNLQANAQQQARQDKQAEVIFDKDNKPQAKYDYSRLNPQPAKPPTSNDWNIGDAISSFLGLKPAQAQPSQPSNAAPVPTLDARAAALAELKRRGAL